MNVSHWISRRLRLGRGGDGSPVAIGIAIAGIAIALIVMEFTLAVVVGFKDGIRDKLMGFDAQMTIGVPISDDESLRHYLKYSAELDSVIHEVVPADCEIRQALRQPGMLKTDDNFQGVIYIGQRADADFTFERENIVEGSWPDYGDAANENVIVMSKQLANALGLGLGDKVYSTFIVDEAIKMRRHTIGALYQSNFGEYDNTVVYASLRGLQRVAGIDENEVNRIDIRGISLDEISDISHQLQQQLVFSAATGALGEYYPVDNILRSGALYFNWLALLDTNVVVIFILMLAVAGFTLVSSLFILILERLPMIGILRAIGAGKPLIKQIFVDLGTKVVLRGMIIGNIAGLGLLLLQKYTHIIKLDPAMYYLASVPVDINPVAIIAVNLGVALAIFLILLIPASVAAAADPSKTIYRE